MAKTATTKKPGKRYGIDELAKALGIKPASARVRLRSEEVAKKGRAYEWSQTEFDALVKRLSKKD